VIKGSPEHRSLENMNLEFLASGEVYEKKS
jgi:hypothetical protein